MLSPRSDDTETRTEGGYIVPGSFVAEMFAAQTSDNVFRSLFPSPTPKPLTLRSRLRLLRLDAKDWLHRRLFPEYVRDD